jgi:hypothetical protein
MRLGGEVHVTLLEAIYRIEIMVSLLYTIKDTQEG